ncbi:hypothetical protein MSHI_24890 [Mycobacterium shinjukuense]|uniref:Uncharacterized protein n=1 Tax=Mycobacterium shinjukuense TaxID=398694 RepID=A0A7I7MSN6_9MYCO|nr:hypothetical protein MSHI_24890 [Mycobacterium shinjukuense]
MIRPGVAGGKLAQSQQPLDPEQEAGPADSTDQHGDLHIAGQYRPGGDGSRAVAFANDGCDELRSDTPGPNRNRNAEFLSRDGMEMGRNA